jgi:hypothetical protein
MALWISRHRALSLLGSRSSQTACNP